MVRLKAFILATSVFVLLTCISIFFLYEWKDLQSLIFTSTIDKARAEKALTEKSVWSDSSLQPHTVLALARLPDFSPSLGVRYLYEKYNLILVSEPVRNNQVCVHAISGDGSSSDPPSMKIWIRVSGPEIQSGVAVPSSPDSSCSYHYDLHPLPPGNYTLDMKLLSVFDDGQEWDFAQCNHEQGTYWDPANSTLLMYKFPISYANSDTKLCCDQCTGHPNCMAYTSNPTKNQIGEVDYPCIFYSEVSGEKLKGGKTSSGTSRSKDHVMKYLGCGHSHVFETCREAGEDDGLYLIEKEFFVSGEVGVEEEKKPICSATELDEITRGRWVKTPLSVCAGEPLQHYNNQQFAHVVRQTGMAEACWVHDNFSKISGQCVRSRRPQSSVWKSHLFEPDFTYTWQPYTCRLPLYTDAILKECLQTKGYRRPEVSGDSVSRMLGTYFAERFDHFPDALFGANRFLVENCRIIHVIWHNGVNEGAKQDVKDYYNKNVGNKTEGEFRIFHRGPFFSSEHQFHITPGRAKAVQDYIEPWLQDEVGFLEADWVNISMAASFESTTRVDGLHVVGSPMKMLFNLIMHAACA